MTVVGIVLPIITVRVQIQCAYGRTNFVGGRIAAQYDCTNTRGMKYCTGTRTTAYCLYHALPCPIIPYLLPYPALPCLTNLV